MDYQKIKNLIEKYDTIIVYRHIHPDGDALGSQFGIKKLIEDNYPNKKVYTAGAQSSYFDNFFPKVQDIPDFIYDGSLAIVLDTPCLDRIEGICIEKCKEIIKIDHHLFVEEFADVEWIKTEASSACELVGEFALNTNLKVSKDTANYLYFGLTTDANRFMYAYTPNMFKVAAFLVENGAEVEKIYNYVFEETEDDSRFWGYCQCNFKKTSYGVGYNKLTPELLESIGVNRYKGSGMVNAISGIKYIDAWAHFSENEDGTIRGELRSKGLPVNTVAASFGGGGHLRAAGCTLMNWDEADLCIQKLDRLVFESKAYHEQFEVAIKTIKEASKIVMDIYKTSDLGTQIKSDNTPVTKADIACDKYLREELSKYYPSYGFLTEESEDDKERLDKEFIWIIDPIDGTKDFVAKDDEFCINLALVKDHKVVLGLIAVPCKNTVYYAFENGGAYKDVNGKITRIFTSRRNENLIGLRSRFHQDMNESKYYKKYEELITDIQEYGSAYKFGLVAEGLGDINLKLTNATKQWDIAPGVIIIKEAGGSFTKPDGSEYEFNTENIVNEEGFIVMNKFNKGLLK